MNPWIRLGTIILGIYFAIYFAFPTYTHRFRLNLEVEVDGKVKTGTGVITVADTDNNWLLMAQSRWSRKTGGPAPWVDLGDRGIIAVAMYWFPNLPDQPRFYFAGELSFVAFFGAEHGNPKINSKNVLAIHSQTGKRELRFDRLPAFIWLPNPADPTSARILAAGQFEKEIGPSVHLVGVEVEITGDRPDRSLYRKLPWLYEMSWRQLFKNPWTPEFTLGAVDLLGDL